MRILICDDNQDAAATLGMVVESDRHEVHLCHDGRRCCEKAREWRPHIALLDIGMPDMTGFAVAKEIRQMDFGEQVLLVAVTGYGSREDVQRAMDVGFDLHLTKPADPARLLRLVASRDNP